jgi:hypothetical protein
MRNAESRISYLVAKEGNFAPPQLLNLVASR